MSTRTLPSLFGTADIEPEDQHHEQQGCSSTVAASAAGEVRATTPDSRARPAHAPHPGHPGGLALPHTSAQDAQANPDAALFGAPRRYESWSGASGTRYIHTVYALVGCPEIPAGNVVLARSAPDGSITPLMIGRLTHEAPSLNLAEVRHLGAKLGADEVHVHLLARSDREAKLIEHDLREANFDCTATGSSREH